MSQLDTGEASNALSIAGQPFYFFFELRQLFLKRKRCSAITFLKMS